MRGFCLSVPARIALGTLVATALALAPLAAQQQPTFRSSTQVVSLFATVTDAQNRLGPGSDPGRLPGLRQRQAAEAAGLPERESADHGGGDAGHQRQHDRARLRCSRRPPNSSSLRLLPDDKAAVGAFNDKIELSAHFSNDRDALITDVKDLDYGNGTRLYDALNESLNQLRGIDGRRVILVFTDGDDTSSRVGRGTVMDRARAEEVMIYAIGLAERILRRTAHGAEQTRLRPAAARRRNRRRILRAEADQRPRAPPSRASRRNCTASTCWASKPSSWTARCTS